MKPPLLLPVFSCLLAASLLGQPSLRAADDDQAAHKEAAEDVLKSMHMETVFATTSERMMTMVDRISDGAARQMGNKPEAAEFQTRMRAQTRDMLKKQFNWELLQPEFVKVYEDAFTTAELKELNKFYQSPIGQKLVLKQPELSEHMGKVTQERAQQVMPVIINMVRSESAKLQGNASPAPGFPGMPPVPGVPPPAPGAPGAPAPGSFPVPPPPPGMDKLPPPPPPAMVPPGAPLPTATPAATPK